MDKKSTDGISNKILIGIIIVLIVGGVSLILFSKSKKNVSSRKDVSVQNKKKSEYMAPDFALKDVFSNKTIKLSDYRGKLVLVNFWATWCPPCRQEIPGLVKLVKKYKGKFIVIGISLDRNGKEPVKQFAKSMKINYPVVMGNNEVVAMYGGISAIPTSYLINQEGEAIGRIIGYRSESQFEQIIKRYIKN